MRNFGQWSISILAVAACSSDNKTTPDAPITVGDDAAVDASIDTFVEPPDSPPTYNFNCEDSVPPTAGANPIVLGGTETTIAINGATPSQTPEANIPVSVHANVSPEEQALASTTTGTGGTYSVSVANAALTPLDVYVKAVKEGQNRPNYVFPPAPFIGNQSNIPLLIFTDTAWSIASSVYLEPETAGNGSIGVAVTDCDNTPVEGATLTVKVNGTALPASQVYDAGALAPQAKGTFIVANVPAGAAEISATYGTGVNLHTWRPHTVRVFAKATTTTTAVP